jgi:hypothetical protein
MTPRHDLREDWGLRIEDSFRTFGPNIFFRFSIFLKCRFVENRIIRTSCCITRSKFLRSKTVYPKPVVHDSDRRSVADPRFATTGLEYICLVSKNFRLVMQQEVLIIRFSTKLHFENIEIRKKNFWILNPQSSRRSCRGVIEKSCFSPKFFFDFFWCNYFYLRGKTWGTLKEVVVSSSNIEIHAWQGTTIWPEIQIVRIVTSRSWVLSCNFVYVSQQDLLRIVYIFIICIDPEIDFSSEKIDCPTQIFFFRWNNTFLMLVFTC